MESKLQSFNEFIKQLDADEQTPVGQLRLKYNELYPDVVFNWVNGIKCIGSLDSVESWMWSRFLLREAYAYMYKPYGSYNSTVDLTNGGHIVVGEWFYNSYYYLGQKKRGKEDNKLRIFKNLGAGFTLVEKEALASYFLLRNNYMKYKDMFKPNKLLALQAINRFARDNAIRFEDSEVVLRGYIY